MNDVCQHGHECLSRCCHNNLCSGFSECIQKCKRNSDCKDQNASCCSFGYCSSKKLCDGKKAEGDNCDINKECISHICSKDPSYNLGKLNNSEEQIGICQASSNNMIDFKTLCAILVVVFAIIMIIVGSAILCRKCFEKDKDNKRKPNQVEIV